MDISTTDNLYDLLASAYTLQSEVRRKTDELKQVKDKIFKLADVNETERSKKLIARDLTAKIAFKEVIKWDQNVLEKLRIDIGDNIFFKIFIWEYKPIRTNISDITHYFDERLANQFLSAAKKQKRSPSIEIFKSNEIN